MRNKKLTAVLAAVLALGVIVGCATQQERAERLAKARTAVTEAIATRQMRIDIKSMNTMRYGSRMVTPDFFLELRGDTLRSYLPYMGQAHQAPMMSPSIGLNFDAPILQYVESRPKKNLSRMEVSVRTLEDSYLYTIEVYDTGEADIRVRSQNRDPVSFNGHVVVE